MASLISIRLYNTDGTPKVWASPLLSAILEKDNSLALDSVAMTEVGEWFYKYNFTDYDRRELYFFFIDGEQYDSINQLDSYGNKETRGRANSIVIDTEQLAKDIRGLKELDMKKDTVGAYVFSLKSYNVEDFNIMIEKVQKNIDKNYESLILKTRDIVSNIKIPKQLSAMEILAPIEKLINENSLENITALNEWVQYIEKIFEDNIVSKIDEIYNTVDSINEWVQWVSDSIKEDMINDKEEIREHIEGMKEKLTDLDKYDIIRIERKDDWMEAKINDAVWNILEEQKEANRKMAILFTRLNSK